MEGTPGSVRPDRVQSVMAEDTAEPDDRESESFFNHTKSTAVDGQGMWRSWTRVFAKPESACLDLLDNCFDAALAPNFEGRVVMEECLTGNSILIQNNSQTPIKKLEAALTVYRSSKNSTLVANGKEAIGENGVGLKQGCATLSDCSVVLTRNKRTVEIGIIAKKLQSSQGVYLPSFSFTVDLGQSTSTSSQEQIRKWLSKNTAILDCLKEVFGPSVNVNHTLAQLVRRMFASGWENEDHVFLLVVCNLKKSAEVPHELIEGVNPAKEFLHEIKNMLPEYYINLPSFNFVIDQERIDFSFWQRRLVELTRFEVNIPPEEPFEMLPETDWDKPAPNKYKLNIYCGFDAQRVDRDLCSGRGTSTCYLYIYSCKAGRLIKKEIDARHLLGLSSSGVDYTQGLTVIVNDITGKLPLTPTKDGIAWSEQASGEIHRRNLFAWAGAVAHCFWTHHRNSLVKNGKKVGSNVKETLKKTIRSFALEGQMADPVTVTENLEDAKLSIFHGIKWIRSQTTHGTHWNIRRYAPRSFSITKGPDTLLCITKDRIKRIKEANAAKRKAIAILTTTDDDSGPIATYAPLNRIANSYGSDEREGLTGSRETHPWPDVDQKNLARVTMGMLSYLRGLDKEKWFELPVLETLPQLKDAYLQVVSKPMDFRTIEEERVHVYTSTAELQQDLILIFQNCIRFNGASSPYGKIAQQMLDILDDAFQSVLLGKRCKKRVNYDEIDNRYNDIGRQGRYTYRPSSSGNKATPSNAQLQRQLQAERMKVKELQKQLAARDKRIQELEARQFPQADERTSRQNPQPTEAKTEGCQICGNDNDHDWMLLCDICDDEYHTYCLDPPLSSVPSGSWLCGECSKEVDFSPTEDDAEMTSVDSV